MKISAVPALGVVSLLALVTGGCMVGSSEDPNQVDDLNGTDGEIDESELSEGPESVEDDVPVPPTEPLAIGTFARVCNTEGLGLRQRSAPGIDQTIVRGLPEGAFVEIIGESDGWRQNSWDGLAGWSSAAYLCAAAAEDPAPIDVVINGWTRPLADYRFSQAFKGIYVHNGVDLAKPYGSVVYAAHAGRVTEIIKGYCKSGYACKGTGKNWALDPKYWMSGDKIVVKHADGMKTIYDHVGPGGLSYVGMPVYPDTPIGVINATGNRSGAHLHFAVMNKAGQYVNPVTYVSWL